MYDVLSSHDGGATHSLLTEEVKGVRAPVEGKGWVQRKRV